MGIRASDADRDRTVAELERHTGAGRLTLDEFADRVRVVCDARTVEELSAVLHDLPALADASAETEPPTGHRRDLLLLFAIAAVTLVLLFGYVAATR